MAATTFEAAWSDGYNAGANDAYRSEQIRAASGGSHGLLDEDMTSNPYARETPSGLTNERKGMDYIPNRDIKAGPCSSCGSSWERCLQGWDEGVRHPEGVCCPSCHNTDTHQADEARRRYREAQDAPSGDALDRATKIAVRHIPSSVSGRGRLIEEIAKLIDRADAASDPTRQVNRLTRHIADLDAVIRRRNARIEELEGNYRDVTALLATIDELRQRLSSIERSTTSLLQTMTDNQLVNELQRRLSK